MVNPLSLVKSDILLPVIVTLAAATVPVVILPPSIVVDPLEPRSPASNGVILELPSPRTPELVNVTRPLNPIPCCAAWNTRLLPEDVPPVSYTHLTQPTILLV